MIVLEPYATMIIEGGKTWELRSRKPPASRLGKSIYLLSAGEILGVVRIMSCSGPLSEAELLAHFKEHRVEEPEPRLYAWRLEVVRRFLRRRKYVHAQGARIWVKRVQPRIEVGRSR